MRELVFALEYDPGRNAVADVLATHSEARIRSLSLHATADSLWRVDHATGASDALDAIEDAFLTTDYYADCLATDPCGATSETEVLDRVSDALVLYTYWERTPICASIPHLALDHLGDGPLFETHHEGRRHTWRIVHHEEADVHAFFDALRTETGEGVELDVRRLAELSPSTAESDSLPRKQREALRAATEHGYYETPRAIDLAGLAAEIDVPRSTLAYRLRRAEAHLATRFLEQERLSEGIEST